MTEDKVKHSTKMQNSSVVTRQGAQKAKIQTRAMLKTVEKRKPNAAILEVKRKGKSKLKEKQDEVTVNDVFQKAIASIKLLRNTTGVVYDESMCQHKCIWDSNYPEKPERLTKILQRCSYLGLLDRCTKIQSRKASKDEILLKHSEDHYDFLKKLSIVENQDDLEEMSSHFDAIYFHPSTFEMSLMCVGSTIDLVKNISDGKIQNGMAIIRPPGHHAMYNEYNGYCFFNNVAIAAQYALDKLNMKRILIVDWDVHHGQGTQKMFYNDSRVLYFSIHRYEYGTFWPNLRESDFDFIGEGDGKGYNFNLPLNKIGMKNGDYSAILNQLLMPVALEFCPQLVLISAGYDSALGDEKGEMEITPAFYAHLLNPLLSLAEGKVAVILEGGYCLESLAESAAITLRGLLGDPCPIIEQLTPPSESIQESILNCIYSHRSYWKCLQVQKTYTLVESNNVNPQPDLHKVVQIFNADIVKPKIFKTRDCYPIHNNIELSLISEKLMNLKLTTKLIFPNVRLCYVYDELMTEHKNLFENGHPENPNRIVKIKEKHIEYGLFERMEKIDSRHATNDEICSVHSRTYVNLIRRSVERDEMQKIASSFNSVYFHPKTFTCATLAAGSVLQVVDNILNGNARSGICIVRPPGHHAESDLPHGFCIFNNVAIAAQYAIRDHGLKRILIVDWDVHHGNGTQKLFENSPNVLYISIHRYDDGNFFPKGKYGNYNVVGKGKGEGFNVNIPWNKKGMGDMEYSIAFQNIIMPIAYEYQPELVIVSAGFDAAIGDPLGGCKVSPEAYGHFTHWLSSLAGGKIIICLEGGYNVNSISYAMTMCSKALLGDPLPSLCINYRQGITTSCLETIQNVLNVQEKYWKSLKFNKKLPDITNIEMQLNHLTSMLKISKCANNDDDENISSNDKQQVQKNTSSSNLGSQNIKLPEDFRSIEQLDVKDKDHVHKAIKSCPHVSLLKPENAPEILDSISQCSECHITTDNCVCLDCYKVFCNSQNKEHILSHHTETKHPLALNFDDLTVWCYICESLIEDIILNKYRNKVYNQKLSKQQEIIKPKDLIDYEQAGPSNPTKQNQTLTDFLIENIHSLVNEEMFAVVPLKTCPHLSLLCVQDAPKQINTKEHCTKCDSSNENWFCLLCYEILCGRYVNEHMLHHHLDTSHPLTLSFADLSVWCYICGAYIDNSALYKYKNLAHIDKFGEEMPWSYENENKQK